MNNPTTWHMHAHDHAIPHAKGIDAQFHRVDVPRDISDNKGVSHNPTVCVHGDRLLINVRVSHDRHTRNFLGRLGDDWHVYGLREIRNDWAHSGHNISKDPKAYAGQGRMEIEDLRLFSWRGRLWAVAAAHEGGHNPQNIRQALVEIVDDDGLCFGWPHLQQSDRLEKNWMPCVMNGGLKLIYSASPLIIMDVDSEYMKVSPSAHDVQKVTSHMRGSSQLIPYEEGWLGMVHQVYKPPKAPPQYNPLMSDFWPPIVQHPISGTATLVYLHQFMKFSADLRYVHVGKPFFFRDATIEFCSGLAYWKGQYVAGVGYEEREAWIAVIEPETIRSLL